MDDEYSRDSLLLKHRTLSLPVLDVGHRLHYITQGTPVSDDVAGVTTRHKRKSGEEVVASGSRKAPVLRQSIPRITRTTSVARSAPIAVPPPSKKHKTNNSSNVTSASYPSTAGFSRPTASSNSDVGSITSNANIMIKKNKPVTATLPYKHAAHQDTIAPTQEQKYSQGLPKLIFSTPTKTAASTLLVETSFEAEQAFSRSPRVLRSPPVLKSVPKLGLNKVCKKLFPSSHICIFIDGGVRRILASLQLHVQPRCLPTRSLQCPFRPHLCSLSLLSHPLSWLRTKKNFHKFLTYLSLQLLCLCLMLKKSTN